MRVNKAYINTGTHCKAQACRVIVGGYNTNLKHSKATTQQLIVQWKFGAHTMRVDFDQRGL